MATINQLLQAKLATARQVAEGAAKDAADFASHAAEVEAEVATVTAAAPLGWLDQDADRVRAFIASVAPHIGL